MRNVGDIPTIANLTDMIRAINSRLTEISEVVSKLEGANGQTAVIENALDLQGGVLQNVERIDLSSPVQLRGRITSFSINAIENNSVEDINETLLPEIKGVLKEIAERTSLLEDAIIDIGLATRA